MRSKVLEKHLRMVQSQGEELARASGVPPPILHEAPPRRLIKETGRFDLLPRSFQDFLRSYNGWEHFWSGFSLRGITGEHTARTVENIQSTMGDLATSEGQQPDPSKWGEEANDTFLFLPNHPVIGTDFNGHLLLFDKRRANKRGENPVLVWSHDGGVLQTFTTFSLMLRKIEAEQRRKLDGDDNPRGDPARKRKILEALRRVMARRRQREQEEQEGS